MAGQDLDPPMEDTKEHLNEVIEANEPTTAIAKWSGRRNWQ